VPPSPSHGIPYAFESKCARLLQREAGRGNGRIAWRTDGGKDPIGAMDAGAATTWYGMLELRLGNLPTI